MKVLILGAGPAGLMAAHAASELGHRPIIYSHKGRKSRMHGAQYLHERIPRINCGERFDLRYKLLGTAEEYIQKVYGDRWDGTVSDEVADSINDAWDIRSAYDDLWCKYQGAIEPWSAQNPWDIAELIKEVDPAVTISSIPAQSLCINDCEFKQIHFWSTAEIPEKGNGTDWFWQMRPNTCIYDGRNDTPWYRVANIHDHVTTEWPYRFGPPTSDGPVWNVVKPMSTQCECFPEVIRVGRYGKWTRGVLTHHAYFETMEALAQ